MLLSIVTGTFNRIVTLQLLVASVRQQLPKGIAYEFVVVDGGSTDGSLDWLRRQADVHLIEHGELRGAIRAFTDGGNAARGEYVALLNDDVIVHEGALLKAISHLETHRSCGAVAFADNRRGDGRGTEERYSVKGMGVTLATGVETMLYYAQCGVFRKALGDAAGWWGADDPIMGTGRTYGGDNFLSARLYEAGYSIDAVDECAVDDLITGDALRKSYQADGGVYYQRFPTVHIPAQRAVMNGDARLRVLHLPVYESGFPQAANKEAGLTEAFQDLGALCVEVDYLNADFNVPLVAKMWQPDLILVQIQGWGERMTPAHLAAMRQACPGAVIVSWNGDANINGLVSQPMLDLYAHVDLVTTVNAAALPILQTFGVRAAYWQIYYKQPLLPLPDMPTYDVLYQANWYDYRVPLFDLLYSFPGKVGIYGNDARATGNTHYDFAAQAALYANATITIGDTFPFNTRAFVSNRVFQALGAGAFLLQQESEALEEFTGLIPGVHYAEWSTVADLHDQIDDWLKPERADERARIAAAGQAFVREHFSAHAQVRKLMTELLPMLQDERVTA